MGFIVALIVGGFAGYLATLITNSSMGILGNIIVGFLGGVIANLVVGGVSLSDPTLSSFLLTILGSIVLLIAVNIITNGKAR